MRKFIKEFTGLTTSGKKYSNTELAGEMNSRFTSGVRATRTTIHMKLSLDIYIKRPDLMKHYDWTPEKRGHLIELKEQHRGYTYRQLADAMNEEFDFGVRASVNTVTSKLTNSIYPEYPELKNINRTTRK